jgi:hypothetical protein
MMMMAIAPEQEAAYALNFGVSRSDLRPEVQVAYDRLAEERQQARQERERLVAATAWFPDLGVGVRDGNVYEHTAAMKLLGPLAGAHAEPLAGNAGRRRSAGERAAAVALVGPAGAVSRAYKGVAAVAFADGSTSEKMLTDLASVARAQAAAAQFNSLAASVQLADGTPSGEGPVPAQNGAGIVSQLERLAALQSSGFLDDEEFRAAKARIIGS